MDAATTAAVLAIVADDSMDAAMLALLQERERLAMLAAHHESYLAQRHYVGSLQVPRVPGPPMTWQAAYERRHDDLGLAHDAMRTALRALQRGDSDTAEQFLTAEVGSDSEAEDADEEMSEADATDGESTAAGEEEEEEYMEEDDEVSPA